METTKFKTNIKCGACVEKVTPVLNQTAGSGNWEVDLQDPQKTLTIKQKVDSQRIINALEQVGYKAETF